MTAYLNFLWPQGSKEHAPGALSAQKRDQNPKVGEYLKEVKWKDLVRWRCNTDQNAPIALGEVDSKRIEVAMPPEGTSNRGRDGDGGYRGIK